VYCEEESSTLYSESATLANMAGAGPSRPSHLIFKLDLILDAGYGAQTPSTIETFSIQEPSSITWSASSDDKPLADDYTRTKRNI